MFQNDSGGISELNPQPIRVIQTMGDVTFKDWAIFLVGMLIAIIFLFLFQDWEVAQKIVPDLETEQIYLIIHICLVLPIVLVAAMLAFIQSPQTGKFRTRLFRFFKFMVSKKYITPEEMASLYSIKETRENHVHYKNAESDGVFSIWRLNGYDPSLLEAGKFQALIDSLTEFFSVNIRFKIYCTRVGFHIPSKDFALELDHYGINYAKNRYIDRLQELSHGEDMKQTAYFLVIDGPSINKNIQSFGIISSPISGAHLSFTPATNEEISQVLNDIWCDTFDFSNPSVIGTQAVEFDRDTITITKKDGTHEYMRILSFNGIPEQATTSWLGNMLNNHEFSVLMDVSPMEPKEANKYLENMSLTADSIMQTRWFKKRATDIERMKIDHIRQVTQAISESITNGQVGVKEVCFYLIFRDKTRKRINKRINEFREQISSFNVGWILTECRHLQKDALINTRLHDIPALQYHKTAINLLKTGTMTHHGATSAAQSYTNNLPIIQAIDHKILTTSLGLSYPFFTHSSLATEKTWFKGFVQDSGDSSPYFADYWKKNEEYNSFNRFYQGRNGSGKSYTANIDFVTDRLDDKFIISIDPKPERVNLTKNLGGTNLNIGGADPEDPHINIFDILITPNNEGENAKRNQNPLLTQYQANLSNISILLALNPNLPQDKIVLSCFNDVQQYVYEQLFGITLESDFASIPRDKYPLMKDMYDEAKRRFEIETTPETKTAYNELMILLKEHAIGVSAPIFNFHTNIDWNSNRMWNLIVRDIALDYGNKSILACWVLNLIRIAESFMISGQKVVLYIDELHLIHNIDGVLGKLDEFARIDRSFNAALCLINQNFNSIRSTSDPLKREYYESLFTMSQYNFFFTTGEDDVLFLVDMLEGSGSPLSLAERQFITRAGRGKALIVMTAYDRFRVQFDISFWRDIWESDLWATFQDSQHAYDVTTNEPKGQAFATPEEALASMTPTTPDAKDNKDTKTTSKKTSAASSDVVQGGLSFEADSSSNDGGFDTPDSNETVESIEPTSIAVRAAKAENAEQDKVDAEIEAQVEADEDKAAAIDPNNTDNNATNKEAPIVLAEPAVTPEATEQPVVAKADDKKGEAKPTATGNNVFRKKKN